jgi:hypothetical protein
VVIVGTQAQERLAERNRAIIEERDAKVRAQVEEKKRVKAIEIADNRSKAEKRIKARIYIPIYMYVYVYVYVDSSYSEEAGQGHRDRRQPIQGREAHQGTYSRARICIHERALLSGLI